MRPLFSSYVRYYENLTPENIKDLRALVDPQIHFVDPFNDVRGVEHLEKIFTDMFKRVRSPRFVVTDAFEDDSKLLVRWEFEFSSPLIKRGRTHKVTGITMAIAGSDDRIIEHIDYWDSASQLYLHLPLVGWVIRGLRRLFA